MLTGMEDRPFRRLPQHTLANSVLMYPSQGGRYRVEGSMALNSNSSFVNDPFGEPGC